MKFRKEIAPLGDHIVSDKKGNRKKVTITKERALRWIENFKKMRSCGLGVFAPWEHDFDNKPVEKVDDLLNSKNNGGEWVDLSLENGSIWGVVEAATDKDAEAIGNKVKGCSLFADNYEDGSGRIWEDSILHICLTNKPVAQTGNFTSIAMSTSVKNESNSGIISNLLESLRKIGINLSPTGDVDELLKMLTVALDNNSALKENVNGSMPANVKPKAPNLSLVMSTETQEPETEQPTNEQVSNPLGEKLLSQNEELKAKNKELSDRLNEFNSVFKANAKKELASKIDALAEHLGEDEEGKKLVKSLRAELDSTEFAFGENGEVIRTPLHSEIDLHLKYVVKKEKKVEENSNKIPSNVEKKEIEDEPNDDPSFIDPSKLSEYIQSMPK